MPNSPLDKIIVGDLSVFSPSRGFGQAETASPSVSPLTLPSTDLTTDEDPSTDLTTDEGPSTDFASEGSVIDAMVTYNLTNYELRLAQFILDDQDAFYRTSTDEEKAGLLNAGLSVFLDDLVLPAKEQSTSYQHAYISYPKDHHQSGGHAIPASQKRKITDSDNNAKSSVFNTFGQFAHNKQADNRATKKAKLNL